MELQVLQAVPELEVYQEHQVLQEVQVHQVHQEHQVLQEVVELQVHQERQVKDYVILTKFKLHQHLMRMVKYYSMVVLQMQV